MAIRWALAGIACLACAVVAFVPLGHEDARVMFAPPLEEKTLTFPDESAARAFRDDALRRAKVWRATDPAKANLGSNPAHPTGTLSESPVRCRYLPHEANGTTPKFRCVLPDGEVVKVKYGGRTGEIHAEIAASRLLTALGFGADSMFMVEHLRCYGCPLLPFETTVALDHLGARDAVAEQMPEDRYSDFEWVAVERHFPGTEIEAGDQEGWAWYELDSIDPAKGASRAEIDALRLIAVFLSHWDNKAENQRLVCLSGPIEGSTRCDQPFAILQDLGATFGPNKVSLEHWRATPIWSDRASCSVSMSAMPYGGGTFKDVTISEGGRSLLARQLQSLTRGQVTALFESARFKEYGGLMKPRGADAEEWVKAFDDKVRQIAEAGPCPGV